MDAEHRGRVVDVDLERAVHGDQLRRHPGVVHAFAGIEILHRQALHRTREQSLHIIDSEVERSET